MHRFAIIAEVDAESESETESVSESDGESEIEADGESEADIFPIYIDFRIRIALRSARWLYVEYTVCEIIFHV